MNISPAQVHVSSNSAPLIRSLGKSGVHHSESSKDLFKGVRDWHKLLSGAQGTHFCRLAIHKFSRAFHVFSAVNESLASEPTQNGLFVNSSETLGGL